MSKLFCRFGRSSRRSELRRRSYHRAYSLNHFRARSHRNRQRRRLAPPLITLTLRSSRTSPVLFSFLRAHAREYLGVHTAVLHGKLSVCCSRMSHCPVRCDVSSDERQPMMLLYHSSGQFFRRLPDLLKPSSHSSLNWTMLALSIISTTAELV